MRSIYPPRIYVYDEEIVWALDLYKQCFDIYKFTQKKLGGISKGFRELFPELSHKFGGITLPHNITSKFDYLLFAVISKMGGDKVHLIVLINETEFVNQYVDGTLNDLDLITEIQRIINNPNILVGGRTISSTEAAVAVQRHLLKLRDVVTEALTALSGSTEPVYFTRYDPVLTKIGEYIE